MIGHRRELDRDRATSVGGNGELLNHGFIGSASRRHDIEVAQHLRPIDADIEGAPTRGGEEGLRLVQTHQVGAASGQFRNGIAEIAIALALVNRLRCWIAHPAQINRVVVSDRGPPTKIGISHKTARSASPRTDRDASRGGGMSGDWGHCYKCTQQD